MASDLKSRLQEYWFDAPVEVEKAAAACRHGRRYPRLIPAAEVRLFGSRARGQARPDSDVDLLITAPDAWLVVLHSRSEASRRAQEPGSVVREAFSHGVLFDGSSPCSHLW